VLLFDECIPPAVVQALQLLEVECKDLRELRRQRTPDGEVVAIAKAESAVFVTYDLDFTTPALLAEMARQGVCVVMIRRPKGADLAQAAEIILRQMRSWRALCGDEPTIISAGMRSSRARAVSSLPHMKSNAPRR
jgi:predicted nuclease of predicted toxin-antitoxin system